jgi:heme-degrading monooxygenase HmoA
MFSVIFEVQPRREQVGAYLDSADMLRDDLKEAPGFIDNVRYKSLMRDGLILSLSSWRDEKSIVRWRTDAHHQEAQEKGRAAIFSDYHLRVGQITYDTRLPEGCELLEQRLDETEVGEGKAITLIDAKQTPDWIEAHNPHEIALYLGFDLNSYGACVSWDVFNGVADPGEIVLLVLWKDHGSAAEFAQSAIVPDDARVRAIRVIRDYAQRDRREAPQFYRAANDGNAAQA